MCEVGTLVGAEVDPVGPVVGPDVGPAVGPVVGPLVGAEVDPGYDNFEPNIQRIRLILDE
jgi:hypothetical protein